MKADAIDGGLRIIKGGLQPGDRVVVSGIQRAVPGSVVKPIDVAPAAGPPAAPATPAPAAPAAAPGARKDKP